MGSEGWRAASCLIPGGLWQGQGGRSLETGAGGEAGAVVMRSPGSRARPPGHPLVLLGTSCEALETYLTDLCLNLPIWEGRRVPVRINTRESLRKVPNTQYAQET